MIEPLKLHQKHTQGHYPDKWLELIWTHSTIVLDIAQQLAQAYTQKTGDKVDDKLMSAGALLHDIGVYYCYDEDFNADPKLLVRINHGFVGYDVLKKEGFDEEVCRFAITHTATGLTKEDIEREDLPYEKIDYVPVSVEEELVCYADKFHTKIPAFTTFEQQVQQLEKFDPKRKMKMNVFRDKYGLPDLVDLEKRYGQWNREFDNWIESISQSHDKK